jgi:hypothetical protein
MAAQKIVKLEPADGEEESAEVDESQSEVPAEPEVVERFVPLMKPPKKPPKEVKPKRKSPFKRVQLEKHGKKMMSFVIRISLYDFFTLLSQVFVSQVNLNIFRFRPFQI